MGKNSLIEWCHHTFNAWWGCTRVSEGCRNCYAAALSKRYGHNVWGANTGYRQLSKDHWRSPLAWNREAAKTGERHRVFCGSMMDIFDTDAPPRERAKLWPIIKGTKHLDWMLLTKRPDEIGPLLPPDWGDGYENVLLGTSVEDDAVSWRIDALRQISARIRFLSVEPLIGPVTTPFDGIDWALIGGESGPACRPMDLDWVREIRDNCQKSGTAFFLKQLGGFPDKRGKARALLDGELHHELPAGVSSVSL